MSPKYVSDWNKPEHNETPAPVRIPLSDFIDHIHQVLADWEQVKEGVQD